MNSIRNILFLMLVPVLMTAQTFIDEDFGSGTFPPSGWVIDTQSHHWNTIGSNYAGGISPEVRFQWNPIFIGETHLISPEIDLTGLEELRVSFKFMLEHYDGPYTVGVATRSGGGQWNTVWEIVDSTVNIPATEVVESITTPDVGASDFQISWFFSGNSGNIAYWYIDDIKLVGLLEHDVMVDDILNTPYLSGGPVTPQAIIKNVGQNTETFDATCEIKIDGSTVYTETSSQITVDPGITEVITFPDYSSPTQNVLYEVTVTTNLIGDMDSTNNSVTETDNTYTTEKGAVIFETATGTWCSPCQVTAEVMDMLVDSGYRLAVVEYHASDPFESPYAQTRWTYYNIIELTDPFFDGVNYPFPGTFDVQFMYENYQSIIEHLLSFNSPYSLEMYGNYTGLDYNLTINVEKIGTTELHNELVLQVALTESHIPYTWFQQTEVNFAERLMTPDAFGTPLTVMNPGDEQTIELSFSLDTSWVVENCELVAFIQNNEDKKIHQVLKIALPDLPTAVKTYPVNIPVEFALSQNYPNPFNPTTKIKFQISDFEFVNLNIYDVLGNEVAVLINEERSPGSYTVEWNAADLPSGMYFYTLRAGSYTETKKMTLIK